MTVDEIKPVYREALAAHTIFSDAFGIPTADIFVTLTDDGRFLVLTRQDGRQFAFEVAKLPLSRGQFVREWSSVIHLYNTLQQAEREVITEATQTRERAVELITRMTLAGFKAKGL